MSQPFYNGKKKKSLTNRLYHQVSSFLPFGSSSSSSSSWASLAIGTKDQSWFKAVLGKFGFTGVLAAILSFLLYVIYLKVVKKDTQGLIDFLKEKIAQYLFKIPGLNKLPFIKNLLPFGKGKGLIHIPKGTHSALGSIAGTAPGIASKLNPTNWNIFNRHKIAEEEDDQKYQAGEPYGDPNVMATSIVQDLKSMGLKTGVKDLRTLLEVAKSKGKPIDDRQMTVSLAEGKSDEENLY